MSVVTQRKSPKEKALAFAEFGRELSDTIDAAILRERPADAVELSLFSHRIRLCNQNANQWYGHNLESNAGKFYSGSGRFWHCGQKLCSYCLARQAQRTRRKLRMAIADQHLSPLESFRFWTFTIVNPNLSVLRSRQIVAAAWSRFRKLKWFKTHIKGGSKSEEFKMTKSGVHYHLHCIFRVDFLYYDDVRYYWTQCVRRVWPSDLPPLQPDTVDGMLICRDEKIKSLESMINELCKYITKYDSWAKLPTDDLLDICRIRRFPRMFELFGSFSEFSRRVAGEVSLRDSSLPIVHTMDLTDGEAVHGWREKLRKYGLRQALADLENEITEQTNLRLVQLRRRYDRAALFRLQSASKDLDESLIRFVQAIDSAHPIGCLSPSAADPTFLASQPTPPLRDTTEFADWFKRTFMEDGC